MTIDTSKLNSLYINSKKVSSLWLNGKKLKLGEEATSAALTFTALEAPFTVYLQQTGSPYTVSLVYSTDGETWSDYAVGDSITVSRVNAKVMFKAKTTNATFSSSNQSYYSFYSSQRCKVSGNIMSLLDLTSDSVYDYAFYRLFYSNIRVVDASELLLPATTVGRSCYESMFRGCSELTATPLVFPASLVTRDSYKEMFYGCNSLFDASNVQLCCNSISSGGMWGMFQSCTNLTAAPFMPNVTATNWDARTYMFNSARHLAQLSTRQTSWTTGDRGGASWMYNVSSDGIFYCPEALGRDDTIKRGDSAGGCPSNWLVANYDVDGAYLSNAFTRGSYTTAFLEDGSSHTPDFSSLSVHNGQTAQKLADGTDYTITYPADTTTAGTKTCTFTGINSYTGTKDFTYVIAVKSLAACTIEVGSAYDDEGPSYVNVVQPQAGYTLVEDTDYTLSWSTSGDETTVTITGINGWAGTYTTTVAHKTSGTSPVAIYKHSSTETNPIIIQLQAKNNPDEVKLQIKCDDGDWQPFNVYRGTESTQYSAQNIALVRAVDTNSVLSPYDGNKYYYIDAFTRSTGQAAGVDLSGSIASLVDRSEQTVAWADAGTAKLFGHDGWSSGYTYIVDASKLVLPPTTVTKNYHCMYNMFCNQKNLTAIPSLDGLSVDGTANYAFYSMFAGCNRLLSIEMTVPWLVGNASAYIDSFTNMFGGCGLKDVVVKSHFGDGRACDSRFINENYSYFMKEVFRNNSSLSCISTDISSWGFRGGWQNWVNNVSSNGTFICPEALGTDSTIQRGTSFCPTGWSVVNYDVNLKFTAEEANSTIALSAVGNAPAVSLLKSTDGETWSSYNVGDTITLANVGDYVRLKADQPNASFGASTADYNKFVMTGKIAALGNIMQLLDGEQNLTAAPAYSFVNAFNGCTSLTHAPKLPAETLGAQCYTSMFIGCTNLSVAPELPAETLGLSCYMNMFRNCTALSSAPALPATELSGYCYRSMFQGCTALTAAPELPVRTLAEACYLSMFQNCTSLSTMPTLPATTLASNCYYHMFDSCTSLSVASLPVDNPSAANAMSYMFNGCTSLGTLSMPQLKTLSTAQTMMYMLQNCTSLTSIRTKLSSWNSNATGNWLYGASNTGTFTLADQTCVPSRDESGVPVGWTIEEPSIHYVDYVTTNYHALDTSYKPLTTTSLSTCLSGDAYGGSFIGFYTNGDNVDYRLFNYDTTLYFDMGNDRIEAYDYNRSVWNEISTWNYGYECTPEGGTTFSASGTAHSTVDWDTAGTIHIAGDGRGGNNDMNFKGLKIYESNVLVKDFRPAIDSNNVAGLYEEVEGEWFYPTGGTWTAVES